MAGVKAYLRSTVILLGLGTFAWNALLDEKARDSVRRAASKTSALMRSLARAYVGAEEEDDVEATRRNQAWVAQQWKKIGY